MDYLDILDDLKHQQKLIIFAGAGISNKPPSYAPLWNELRNEIVIFLNQRLDLFDLSWKLPLVEQINKAIADLSHSNLAPEIIMEILRQTFKDNVIREIIQKLQLGRPNNIHRLIAELCRKGKITGIITTNIDTYIEEALASSGQTFNKILNISDSNTMKENLLEFDARNYEKFFYAIKSETAFKDYLNSLLHDQREDTFNSSEQIFKKTSNISNSNNIASGVPLIKLHGTAENFETVILTLKSAALGMSPSLKGDLISLLKDKSVLFTGYSGRDIDIFPEIINIVGNCPKSRFFINLLSKNSLSPIKILCDIYPDRVFPIYMDAEDVFSFIADSPQLNVKSLKEDIRNDQKIFLNSKINMEPFEILYFFCEYFYAINNFGSARIFSNYIKDLSDDIFYENQDNYKNRPIEEMLSIIRKRIIGNYFYAKILLLLGEYRWARIYFEKIAEWQCLLDDNDITLDDLEFIDRVFIMKWFAYYSMEPEKWKEHSINALTQFIVNKGFDVCNNGIRLEAMILLGDINAIEGELSTSELLYNIVYHKARKDGFPLYTIIAYYRLLKIPNIQSMETKKMQMERHIENLIAVLNVYNLKNRFI